VRRVEKDIKWMYEGNFDSLIACEEFVQVVCRQAVRPKAIDCVPPCA
jgi:hypothetical protein